MAAAKAAAASGGEINVTRITRAAAFSYRKVPHIKSLRLFISYLRDITTCFADLNLKRAI